MDLELTPDQRELHAIARGLLDDRAPLSLARAFLEGEGDAGTLWASFAELGWYAVGLEEDDPFGVIGLCLLAEQCGAHAAPNLLVDTAVAARLIELDGETPVALATQDADGPAEVGPSVTGTKVGVHHARSAGLIAVTALVDGEPGVAFVAPEQAELVPEPGLDPAAAACRVVLEDAPAVAVTTDGLEEALLVGAVATAAEGIGAASRALDMAVTYALERRQFGRPIGSFQALQHVLAEAHVKRETAWATTLYAAASVDEGLPDHAAAVSIAKAHAARASRDVVHAALQVLGGIAFTWEHDVHLLQRRVLECERRYGDALHHEARLGAALGRTEVAA
jgi:alkylation response protein AidB-like acyl-CoA dehydrogenase